MIGTLLLNECLNNETVGSIISITRKPTDIQHIKLTELIHEDFLNFDSVATYLKDIDICFYCLGVYSGKVSRELFREITVNYTLSLAKTLIAQSSQAGFCFLSGQGADTTEKSKIMFALDKGIAENGLKQLGFRHLAIFRPGYIYPVTPRQEPNTFYRIMRFLYGNQVFWLYPNIGVSSVQLAKAMFTIGLHEKGSMIYENKDIRKIK